MSGAGVGRVLRANKGLQADARAAEAWTLTIMKSGFATTDESKGLSNEFKNLAAYFHSRRHTMSLNQA
jgi:hypothetical protein